MFCPGCAAENGFDQAFCRQCGQRLSGLRLALGGGADQSVEKLKAAEKWISGGSAALAAFTVIAIAIAIIGIAAHDLSLGYIAFINLLLGAVVGLPLLYFGKSRLKSASRLLTGSQTEHAQSRLDRTQPGNDLLTSGLNEGLVNPSIPGSVTEHTTLDLRRPDR